MTGLKADRKFNCTMTIGQAEKIMRLLGVALEGTDWGTNERYDINDQIDHLQREVWKEQAMGSPYVAEIRESIDMGASYGLSYDEGELTSNPDGKLFQHASFSMDSSTKYLMGEHIIYHGCDGHDVTRYSSPGYALAEYLRWSGLPTLKSGSTL